MQSQHLLRRTAAVAVLIIAFCVPPLHAEGEPYEPPEARIGRPPGASAETTTTTTASPSPDGTDSTQVRTDRARVEPRERPFSLWATFMTWLEEQIQSVTTR